MFESRTLLWLSDRVIELRPLSMAALLNPPSTPTTSYRKNTQVHPHSCIISADSQNTGADDGVYLSWLPNYDDHRSTATAASISDHSSHETGQDDFDYSWLPNYNDTNTNTSKTQSKSNNSNRVRKTRNDSWLPNYSSKTSLKSDNLIRSQKPDCSSFPSTHIVNNGNKTNENRNDKNHTKVLNKKPKSSRSQGQVSHKPEYVVETDSLGGVSTLLRRWKDLVETTNSNNITVSSKSGPENDKIRVMNIINKLSKEEENLVSGNTNESFTRWIRGCEAFKEFLSLKEQDKRYELESLAQSKPVSRFSHRSRIKALLRVRFTWLEAESETESVEQDANSEFHVYNRADYDEKELDVDEHKQALEHSCHHWVLSEWNEEDDDDEGYDMHDWISEIVRPRSEWERMRQARYQEMLYLFAFNRDIQELLKRKFVSGFLSSDPRREKIDKLMMSRAQGLLHEEVGWR